MDYFKNNLISYLVGGFTSNYGNVIEIVSHMTEIFHIWLSLDPILCKIHWVFSTECFVYCYKILNQNITLKEIFRQKNLSETSKRPLNSSV